MYKFELEKLLEQLSIVGIQVKEIIEKPDGHLIVFKNSNLRSISVPIDYEGKYNCINIYHSESAKNGFWWDHKIQYKKLVAELLEYHAA